MVNYQDDIMIFEAHTVDRMEVFVAPRIDALESGVAVKDYDHNHNTLLVAYIINNIVDGTIQFRVTGLTV